MSGSGSNKVLLPSVPVPESGEKYPSEEWRTEANRRLESTAQAALNWGNQHEYQIRDFEAELESALSNSRAVHNLLSEALDNIEGNRQRVDRSLTSHIPSIYRSLSQCISSLAQLQTRLPELQQQVRAVTRAYDAGRLKAQLLKKELEWRKAPTHNKLMRVVLPHKRLGEVGGSRSGRGRGVKGFGEEEVDGLPVRKGEVALVRLIVGICLVLICWQIGGVLEGAYRAYRYRLVWGDKLIS